MGRFIVALVVASVAAMPPTSTSWRPAPTPELMLPSSVDCWEPTIAVGPREQVYVFAGWRTAQDSKDFDQKLVLWRSLDGGATFEGPWPVSADGHREADERAAVDLAGTIYVSYLDHATLDPNAPTRLRLARSRDGGRTFAVETIPVARVSDKPELAVSPDGTRIAVVYESSQGPAIVTSTDGDKTWNETRVIEPGNGRHFWPEALTFAPDGTLWFGVPSMSEADIDRQRQTAAQLHLYRSTDDGRNWQDSRVSESPRFVKKCAHDPDCRVKLPSIGIAIDGNGQAFAAYTEGGGPGQLYSLLLTSSADVGRTWSPSRPVSAAPRPQSGDGADHDSPAVAAQGDGRVCVTWVDDRRGALDTFTRCSTDATKTWGDDILLSNRDDGADYKSSHGFESIYGHYGGTAISPQGRLFAAWAEGARGKRTGTVWFNSVPSARASPTTAPRRAAPARAR